MPRGQNQNKRTNDANNKNGQDPAAAPQKPPRRSSRRRRSNRERERDNEETQIASFIEYVDGDMFSDDHQAKALAFGCHPEGVFNTELTLQMRLKYPELSSEYERRCQADPPEFQPGDVIMSRGRDGRAVFMLGTQKDKYLTLATEQQIEQAFRTLREHLDQEGIDTLVMPPIGGGLGALNWHRSRRSLERAFRDWTGKIMVIMKR